MSSLRDENPPAGLILCSCAGQSLIRYTLPSNVLAREFRLVVTDEKPPEKEAEKARRELEKRGSQK